jgi:hypothetical protein
MKLKQVISLIHKTEEDNENYCWRLCTKYWWASIIEVQTSMIEDGRTSQVRDIVNYAKQLPRHVSCSSFFSRPL